MPFGNVERLSFNRRSLADQPQIFLRRDREVAGVVERFDKPVKLFRRSDPTLGGISTQIKRGGEGEHGASPAIHDVLVEIRHRKFARRGIHGVAIPQYCVIRLAYRTPAAVLPEQRYNVVLIGWNRLN